jgi:hypothetical protein
MRRTSITVMAALATLAFATPAHALTAKTKSVGNVTDTSATLRGEVGAGLLDVGPAYYFEYGRTEAYGKQTPALAFSGDPKVNVTLVGLAPSTTYHYRVVTTGLLTAARGGDESFKTEDPQGDQGQDQSGGGTSGDSGSGSGAGSGTDSGSGSTSGSGSGGADAGSGDAQGSDPSGSGWGPGDNGSNGDEISVVVDPDDSDKPVLGSTVGAAPESGSIEVQAPGATDFKPLPDGASIPVGSTVDARQGSVKLVTAVGDKGAVQTATFKGAVFQVKQSDKSAGLTDIYLRGGDFSACKAGSGLPAGVHSLAKKKKGRAIRKLWGHDHHGRFRTHGRGAIATVRGTTWVVADHCDGTRTSVLSGSVSVRDERRHKTVLVHAGHSYFARTQH